MEDQLLEVLAYVEPNAEKRENLLYKFEGNIFVEVIFVTKKSNKLINFHYRTIDIIIRGF